MTTISGSTPLQGNNYYSASTKALQTSPVPPIQDDQNKIVIEIKPGEDNVSSGDKSKNTAQISITTPNRELEAEVSREGVFNAVEKRTYRKMANQALGGGQNNNSLIKGALAVKSGVVDKENLEELAYLTVKKDQIQTYSTATQNSPYGTTNTGQQASSTQTSSPLQQYNDAKNSYMKQQFVFSKINGLNISESA